MIHECAPSKESEIERVCGLFGNEKIPGTDSEGFLLALREMVTHFQITWRSTPLQESDSGEECSDRVCS